MSDITVKIPIKDDEFQIDSLHNYCLRLSKQNNSVLFLLESYLNKNLLDEPELLEIRRIILTVSANVSRLNYYIQSDEGDKNE